MSLVINFENGITREHLDAVRNSIGELDSAYEQIIGWVTASGVADLMQIYGFIPIVEYAPASLRSALPNEVGCVDDWVMVLKPAQK